MKNLVFSRIFLHCVALGFIVSGLLLSGRPEVQILLATPANNAESLCFQGFSAFFNKSRCDYGDWIMVLNFTSNSDFWQAIKNRTAVIRQKLLLIISWKRAVFANENAPPANQAKNRAKNPAKTKGGCSEFYAVIRNKIEYYHVHRASICPCIGDG